MQVADPGDCLELLGLLEAVDDHAETKSEVHQALLESVKFDSPEQQNSLSHSRLLYAEPVGSHYSRFFGQSEVYIARTHLTFCPGHTYIAECSSHTQTSFAERNSTISAVAQVSRRQFPGLDRAGNRTAIGHKSFSSIASLRATGCLSVRNYVSAGWRRNCDISKPGFALPRDGARQGSPLGVRRRHCDSPSGHQ